MKIFTYGSLLDDNIRYRVLDKHVDGETDTLKGYKLSDHTLLPYPTIVPFKDGMVGSEANDDVIGRGHDSPIPFFYNF